MKPIKFRAWDKETEFMVYSDREYEDYYFGFDDVSYPSKKKGIVVCWKRVTVSATIDEPQYDVGEPIYDVMQFTGLTDKNDKEIYEGDIIKNVLGKVGQIVFSHIGCGETFTGFWVNYIGMIGHWGILPKNLEVIGNVYENPELLENYNG